MDPSKPLARGRAPAGLHSPHAMWSCISSSVALSSAQPRAPGRGLCVGLVARDAGAPGERRLRKDHPRVGAGAGRRLGRVGTLQGSHRIGGGPAVEPHRGHGEYFQTEKRASTSWLQVCRLDKIPLLATPRQRRTCSGAHRGQWGSCPTHSRGGHSALTLPVHTLVCSIKGWSQRNM